MEAAFPRDDPNPTRERGTHEGRRREGCNFIPSLRFGFGLTRIFGVSDRLQYSHFILCRLGVVPFGQEDKLSEDLSWCVVVMQSMDAYPTDDIATEKPSTFPTRSSSL